MNISKRDLRVRTIYDYKLYEFDKEKKFISYNIENTKKAYGIDINQENFVMRGATVKNVKHVYGLVVYTGMETKMMMREFARQILHATIMK